MAADSRSVDNFSVDKETLPRPSEAGGKVANYLLSL